MKINKKTLMVTGVFLLVAIFVTSYFAFTSVTARAIAGKCNNPPSGTCTAGTHKCVEGAGASNACVYNCKADGSGYGGTGTACLGTMCDGGECGAQGAIPIDYTLNELGIAGTSPAPY
jgi:hypothetical protein